MANSLIPTEFYRLLPNFLTVVTSVTLVLTLIIVTAFYRRYKVQIIVKIVTKHILNPYRFLVSSTSKNAIKFRDRQRKFSSLEASLNSLLNLKVIRIPTLIYPRLLYHGFPFFFLTQEIVPLFVKLYKTWGKYPVTRLWIGPLAMFSVNSAEGVEVFDYTMHLFLNLHSFLLTFHLEIPDR